MCVQFLSLVLLLFPTLLFAAGHDLSEPTFGPSGYTLSSPLIASNGETFLTVWTSRQGYTRDLQVYVSQADADGRPAAVTASRLLAAGDPFATLYALVPAGSDYALLWGNSAKASFLTRIAPDGKAIATSPLPISPVAAAWNGSHLLLAYLQPQQQSLRGAIVDLDGRIVRDGLLLWDASVAATEIIADGDDFLLTVTAPNGLWLQRVGGDGTVAPGRVLVQAAIETPADTVWPGRPSLVKIGADVVLAFPLHHNGRADLEVAVVDAAGNVAQRLPAPSERRVAGAALVRDGDRLLVVFGAFGEPLKAMRLNAGAVPMEAPAILVGSSLKPAGLGGAATNGRTIAVAASELSGLGTRLLRSALPAGVPIAAATTTAVSIIESIQSTPAVATNGFDYLAVWNERTAEAHTISASRIGANGERLGPRIEIYRSPSGIYAPPAVAWGNGVYLVVWPLATGLVGARVTASGTLLDANPFDIRLGYTSAPAVAWNGRNFVVIWSEAGRIAAASVTADALVSSSHFINADPPPLPNVVIHHDLPSIAWDGTRFLAVWMTARIPNGRSEIGTAYDATSTRLSAYGLPLDTNDLTIASDVARPRVASAGGSFLVVYDTYERGTFGAIVRADASPRVEKRFEILPDFTASSDVASDGHEYTVGFRYDSFLGAARISAAGEVTSPPRAIGLPQADVDSPFPAISFNALGDALIVTSEMKTDAGRATGYLASELPIVLQPPPARRRSR